MSDSILAQLESSTLYELRNTIMLGLHGLGIMELQIEYHGGGDSGDIEEVTWYPDTVGLDVLQSTMVEVTRYFEGWFNKSPRNYFVGETVTLKEAVDSFFWTVVSTYFPGWEINEGGSGMIAFDLTDNTVTLYHTTYYQSSQEDIVEL
jgi:hypothetical protein